MRILVVDPDAQYSDLVAQRLGEDGHEVSVADNPDKMAALIRIRTPDVVFIDLSRRRMNGFDVARDLREVHGPNLRVFLTSPSHQATDAEVTGLIAELGVAMFFARTSDLDVLAEAVASPAPSPVPVASTTRPQPARSETVVAERGGAPSGRTSSPKSSSAKRTVSWDTARTLVDVWSRRASGTLRIQAPSGAVDVLIRDGGLVDTQSIYAVEAALAGAPAHFEPGPVEGVGDWTLFGNQIFVGCRMVCEESTALGYMSAVPMSTQSTQMARALTLTGPTRRLMGAIDEESELGELLLRIQAAPSEVSSDLEALVLLGFLTLRRGELIEDSGGSGALDVATTPQDVHALQGARESTDLEGLPTIAQSAVASAHDSESPDKVHERLARELQTIDGAAPPVVLGVPPESGTSLVDEAAARMRDRYARLANDGRLSEETRELAQRIGRLISEAHRHFVFVDSSQEEAPEASGHGLADMDRVEVLLDEGRKLIGRGEWAAADAILTEAHRHQLDHPGVLANLGWARLHNPARSEADRSDEGRDFLLLGEQFDPTDAEGQYFLAQYLLASNMLQAASERARRAKDAAPGDPARAALHRKIQIKLAAATQG